MSTSSAHPAGDLLSASVRLPQHVVYRVFPAETVVLNLNTGKYHGLDPVGGRMLEVMDAAGAVREAAEQLAKEFDTTPAEVIEADLCEFCAELAARGLLEVVGDGAAA